MNVSSPITVVALVTAISAALLGAPAVVVGALVAALVIEVFTLLPGR